MHSRSLNLRFAWAALVVCALLFAGCSLRVDKEKEGKSDRVEIETPIGDLKVRTNINPKDIGLSVYPLARPTEKSHDGDDDHSANVNISTPFFGLKVLAMEFESDDPPEKVLEFYRKDMSRYGKVVQCRGSEHTGASSDSKGKDEIHLKLECDKEDPTSKNIELKAGQGNSQHIVGVKPKGKGTEFGLVYIQIRGDERETM